ncbi:hypothetical protein SAMN04489725_101147 [Alicyclobacillus hesperidum]|uniref:Uncharacterized protein n=1 Tax=Alicyclobacillus hesperidum TaxID=89784 RepID=A0A1H2Q8X9_9BACL|nr:hypothetical protein SAMN04489725_101147 [Alicyclobacillus hesperidum]
MASNANGNRKRYLARGDADKTVTFSFIVTLLAMHKVKIP